MFNSQKAEALATKTPWVFNNNNYVTDFGNNMADI